MNSVVALVPVGEYIADELRDRGWTRADFAEILGRPPQFVSEVIAGKKELTRESAAQIGAAFNTSPDIWLGIQDRYHLWRQHQDSVRQNELDEVRVRAKLNELAPMSILRQRGIISSSNVSDQAEELRKLLEIESLNERPRFAAAARRSNPEEAVSATQVSWLACVRQQGRQRTAGRYESTALTELAENLSRMLSVAQNFSRLPELFADVGVRLVYVEAFPSSKLDGCALMLDGNPVIGLSGRGKRLDKVLFTLLHEVAHVILGHVADLAIIDDVDDYHTMGEEQMADSCAAEWILPGGVPAVPDRIAAEWVDQLAADRGVHPLVVIGRLQKQGRLTWRTSLVKGAVSVTPYLSSWR